MSISVNPSGHNSPFYIYINLRDLDSREYFIYHPYI